MILQCIFLFSLQKLGYSKFINVVTFCQMLIKYAGIDLKILPMKSRRLRNTLELSID